MANRYENIEILRTELGKRYKKTIRYPKMEKSPEDKYIITFNQWFDESLFKEKAIQPISYPSISNKNLINFEKKFFKEFKEKPNHLSLLSYDLVGLIYFLSLNNEITDLNKLFKKKNSFKGKIGIFDIKDNKIYHRLNFYQIKDCDLIEIFWFF